MEEKLLKRIRYDFLIDSIDIIKPKKIIEIGLAQGLRSFQMIKQAYIFNKEIDFCGYDVFDTKDENWHKIVGNGKKVFSQSYIQKLLMPLNANIKFYPGMTCDTLWKNHNKADLVFLDGDHRIEAIKNDFNAVKNSKVIVFDDYYITGEHNNFTIDKYGCNELIQSFPENQVFISPPTLKFPDVRVAFWSMELKIIEDLKKAFL